MLKFYGYKKCSTCCKAENFLRKAEIDYQFIDITANPPSAEQLATIAKLAAISLRKLFNSSGAQYRELKIKTQLATLSESKMLALLASNGRLIKRPIITNDKRATVGFKEDLFTETWL